MKINIVLPISRSTYLKELVNSLNNLEAPEQTKLIIIVDGPKELFDEVKSQKIKFTRIIHRFEARRLDERDIYGRRQRIADLHNRFADNVRAEYVFGMEDDSIVPPDALMRLLKIALEKQEDFGCAYGVELGRHSVPYVGIWSVDDVVNTTKMTSLMPSSGVQEVDAGGFYCFLTPAELYTMHYFQPYTDEDSWLSGAGPDIEYGLYLRTFGFKNYVDWGLNVKHLTEFGIISVENTTPRCVSLLKVYGGWTNIINPL